MVEQVKSFMELNGDWKDIAKKYSDFNDARQTALKKTMSQCGKDTEFPLGKDIDLEHENFNYFALCLRSNVNLNPSLNNSKGVRNAVLGWNF